MDVDNQNSSLWHCSLSLISNPVKRIVCKEWLQVLRGEDEGLDVKNQAGVYWANQI